MKKLILGTVLAAVTATGAMADCSTNMTATINGKTAVSNFIVIVAPDKNIWYTNEDRSSNFHDSFHLTAAFPCSTIARYIIDKYEKLDTEIKLTMNQTHDSLRATYMQGPDVIQETINFTETN